MSASQTKIKAPPQMDPLNQILDKVCLSPLAVAGLLLLLVLPHLPYFSQEYMIRFMVMAAFYGACAVAFDFTAGYINIVNFGFMALAGLGGYTSTLLSTNLGISPWLTIFAGAAMSAVVGLGTGLVTLRLRGIFAAVMAWFVGLALMGIATKWVALTRGPLGLPAPRFFETASNLPYYYLILLILMVVYLCCRYVTRSQVGLAFKAIGQNMEAARTSGINPVIFRLLNFTLSCGLAGLLGGFYAHYIGILTPEFMHTSKTVEVLAVAYIGGRGSLWGGAVIAFPFINLMELLRSEFSNLPGMHLVIYGAC
jgi:branched-chain amino acid transport system permease protein